jgi:hypothetical protein
MIPLCTFHNHCESKFRLSRIKVLVPRCRKPYYLHSFSQIYLSKHVYYLGIKIGSQVSHLVIDFDIFTLGYFTCLFHNNTHVLTGKFDLTNVNNMAFYISGPKLLFKTTEISTHPNSTQQESNYIYLYTTKFGTQNITQTPLI